MGVTSPPPTRFEMESALEQHTKGVDHVPSAKPAPPSLLDAAAQAAAEFLAPFTANKASKPPTEHAPAAVVVVDPCSSGSVFANELHTRGVPLVCVWSDVCTDELISAHVREGMRVPFLSTVRHTCPADLPATLDALRRVGTPIGDVIVGCETGVLLADLLAEELGVRGNGTSKSNLRRNKWFQTEAVRAAGLNACGQKLATCREDVESFLSSNEFPTPFKAVVKPVEGAGSDGVFICDSPDAVRDAFKALEGTKNALGLENYSVLLQEYLSGEEYVVDTVSRDGEHKCVALWVYDKRLFNGSPICYYGMRLIEDVATNPLAQDIIRYVLSVLTPLGIMNGAVHAEVKATPRGPVLVEANCRLHGADGQWDPVCRRCLGYSQITALADAYLDPASFARLPSLPINMKGSGACIDVRSTVEGTFTRFNEEGLRRIRELPSYISEVLDIKPGDKIRLTVDALTIAGGIQIANTDGAQMEKDYNLIQEVIGDGLFEVAQEHATHKADSSKDIESESA